MGKYEKKLERSDVGGKTEHDIYHFFMGKFERSYNKVDGWVGGGGGVNRNGGGRGRK
jgi:hypothetical protein